MRDRLQSDLGVDVSRSAVHRTLRSLEHTTRDPRLAPPVSNSGNNRPHESPPESPSSLRQYESADATRMQLQSTSSNGTSSCLQNVMVALSSSTSSSGSGSPSRSISDPPPSVADPVVRSGMRERHVHDEDGARHAAVGASERRDSMSMPQLHVQRFQEARHNTSDDNFCEECERQSHS
ncbi:hypothetical protein FI667_g9157, partial [Globisporangium splendens]